MKKIMVILILFSSSLFLNCCDDDPTNITGLKKYPTKLGNEWEYNTTFIFIFYDSSGNVYGNDTLAIGNTIAEVIEENDSLDGFNDLVLFAAYDIDTPLDTSYLWYRNSDEGLFAVAYSNPASSQPILPKSNSIFLNNLLEKIFKSSLTPGVFVNIDNVVEDSIQYYEPIRMIGPYPLIVGKSWTESISPFTVNRTITSRQEVITSSGKYLCYLVKTEIEDFPNINYEDFINLDVGLVLRKIEVDSMIHSNEFGDTLGFYNSISTSELIRRN